MKKIILSIFTFIGLASSAQTITEANHAPMNGDRLFSTYQCDSTGINPGGTGAGQTWDFSAYTPHLSTIKTYSTLTSANAAYNPADVSVSSGSTNTNYYRSATTKLNYFGGDLLISSVALNIKYSTPAVVMLYPMSLNSASTSITSGTVNATSPIPFSGPFTGTCSVIADATGTLVLPSKTFSNVIRVVTSQTLIASSLGATVNTLVYDYYSPNDSKAPLFTIDSSFVSSGLGNSAQKIVTLLKDYDVVSVNENKKTSIELLVFPNPATTFINFSTASLEATKVIAFDMTGKIVATEVMEMGKAKMNIANLASGVYMYQVTNKNNQTLTTGKFNVGK